MMFVEWGRLSRGLALTLVIVTAMAAGARAAQEAAPTETGSVDAAPAPTPEAAPVPEAATAPAAELDVQATLASHKVLLDTLWVMLTAFLVFWMQAGFAYVEGGLTRAKNTNNIMMKNLMDFCLGTVAFYAVGFGLMFGDGNPFVGMTGWFLQGADNSPAIGDAYSGVYSALNWTSVPLFAKFMFQLVFAGTAATIVSGAMAERTKFSAYLVYSFFISAFIYPIVGHWIWGGGWLANLGMWDFAGSTVVHSTRGLDGPGRRDHPRTAHRQVHQGQGADGDPRPLAADGRSRRLHPLAGLVRLQPGLDHGGGPLDRPDRDDDQPGRSHRRRSPRWSPRGRSSRRPTSA